METAKAAPDGAGDVWTWTALDADTKMILSWTVGGRDAPSAQVFMDDLSSRLVGRVQLTTDGHLAYVKAVEDSFGPGVDYAMLVKKYGESADPGPERKYSPAVCVGASKQAVIGNPDIEHVSTSYVERQNLNMRMGMLRFTRLTNAFPKKLESHYHALSLYFMFYNFVRIHKSLKQTPAMAAGLSDRLWSMEDLAEMVDAAKPDKRGPYKKRVTDAE